MSSRSSAWRPEPRVALVAALAVGLILRLVLAFVVAPGAGYAGDMNLFLQWARGFAATGPTSFYATVSTANYPPVAIWLLGGLWAVSTVVSTVVGSTSEHAFVVLLKLPSILADLGTAAIVWHLVRRRASDPAGVGAAAIYLLLPAVWYDSALWGQLDSVLVLGSIGALALLLARRPMLAGVVAMVTLLFKPQGVVVALVVYLVIVVTELRRDASGRRHPSRLLGIAAVAALTMVVILVPFDFEGAAGSTWSAIPVAGDIVGFAAQSAGTAATYPVLTANAYNVWALVGSPPLVSTVGSGTAVWLVDSLPILGVAANVLGIAVLGLAVALVCLGLVRRTDDTAVLFGYTVLTAAFFAFPTRVHERYLLPAFVGATVLAAPHVARLAVVFALSIVNGVNLHAILADGPGLQVRNADGTTGSVGASSSGVGGGRPTGGVPGAGGWGSGPPAGPPGQGGGRFRPEVRGGGAQSLRLPFGDLARAEWVAVLASIAQTAAAVVLVVAWVVFVLRTTAVEREVRR